MRVIKLTACLVLVLLTGTVDQASSSSIEASGVRQRSGSDEGEEVSRVDRYPKEAVREDTRTRRIPRNWLSRKRIGQIFTEWSPWSVCDDDCRQRRERHCRLLRKCSDTKHVEERRCPAFQCKSQTTRGQTNNNMGANNLLESNSSSTDRSADENTTAAGFNFDVDVNKFIPKLRGETGDQMNESEFQIIKINHKKPEIQTNKLEFARPVVNLIQIETPAPILDHLSSSSSTRNESDTWDPEGPLLGILINSKLDPDLEDFDEYSDNDYPMMDVDSKLIHVRRKYKNGPTRKYPALNNVVADPTGQSYRVYTRWSKWSKCSGKCTTRRFKKCRMKEICGNEVLREVAYCYTEGSFCEEWITRQMYNNVPRPSQQQSASNQLSPQSLYPIEPALPTNRNPSSYQERKLPIRLAAPGQCGIAAVSNSKGRKSASHMLRIIGGKVVRRGSYPWQVAILNRFKEAFCGGTLISKQWILTAAHCVRKRLYVRLGEHNLEQRDGTEVEYRVEYAIRHPHYDKSTVDNDIALLRLPKEIIPSAYIGLACLPQKYQRLPIGTKCTIIGWGKRKNLDDAGTKFLHEAQVPIVNPEDCKAVYDDYTITKNMFCAGHKRGRIDTCSGDSGGPILCKDASTAQWSILGVTSFGDGCGKRNKFGIYTKVANYVDWIQSVIECNGNCRRF